MPENLQQELICINVDKVYDWVLKENTFDFFPTSPLTFPGLPLGSVLTGSTLTCEVTPAQTSPVVIVSRETRPFTINGSTVCLQQLVIRKSFTIVFVLTLQNGTVFRSTPISFSRAEQVVLCAPEGTDVNITFTELNCFISAQGTLGLGTSAGTVTVTGLVVSITTCQSIQSTHPVTVEFLADFCQPRADIIGSCPLPSRPQQCPTIYPD